MSFGMGVFLLSDSFRVVGGGQRRSVRSLAFFFVSNVAPFFVSSLAFFFVGSLAPFFVGR